MRGEARGWQVGPHQPRTLKAPHSDCTGAASLYQQRPPRAAEGGAHASTSHDQGLCLLIFGIGGSVSQASVHGTLIHGVLLQLCPWCRVTHPWLSCWVHVDFHLPCLEPAQSKQPGQAPGLSAVTSPRSKQSHVPCKDKAYFCVEMASVETTGTRGWQESLSL